MSARKPFNPFYSLLVAVGIGFVVTASAYGVMAFRAAHGTAASAVVDRGHPLWTWIDRYGTPTLLAELGLLAVLTCGAIATDGYWTRRAGNDLRGGAADGPKQGENRTTEGSIP